ncbi:TIGR02147 family protein [Bdellovibrio svalbardensis]|uniref:TIGR02147 family protein n=1 Tax=Bdellovibrio svalbardensis TaxID=2972972 RepID=A0ABT6DK22_9BACT|nr:TIGR02147 family protein [Bdellovibrio svalbardensis]MDG0817200.1 TIGR02147 family protein [Bdellovibrio svalbardensis]
MIQKPAILSYQNVVLFLQHYYEYRKGLDVFSYTKWAQELGLKNRAYLRMVVMGERPISESIAEAFVAALQFNDVESDYFMTLVNYNQCKTGEQKRTFAKKLLRFQMNAEDFLEVENHYEFLADELLPRIQTLLSFEDVAKDTAKAAQILGISVQKFFDSCSKLEKMGLLEKQEVGGESKWVVVKKSWRLPNNFRGLGYKEFYKDAWRRAEEAIEKYEAHERRFRNLFVAMSASEFEDFLRDFETFVQEQSAKRNVDHLFNRRLYQLNFSFFPSTEIMS